MTSRHHRSTLIAAAAACACSSAWSQAETPQRVEITATPAWKFDERSASGSRLGLTLRETPATVQVITRAELDAMAVIDSQDALVNIPGVSFSAQPGAAGSVFYRGFGSSSLAQLYNGISVQYDAISARPVDPWLIERVESVGGPSSFLNGSGAVGGSINLITKIADRQGDLSQVRLGLGNQRQLALSLQRGLATQGGGGHVLRLDVNGTQGAQRSQGRDRDTWQAAVSWRAALGGEASHTLSVVRSYIPRTPVMPSDLMRFWPLSGRSATVSAGTMVLMLDSWCAPWCGRSGLSVDSRLCALKRFCTAFAPRPAGVFA